MRLLLDTHAWLWWISNDPRLPVKARDLIGDNDIEVFVSAATAMEVATKYRIGKMDEAAEAVARYDEFITRYAFRHLPVSHYHALTAGSYQVEHKDPFDRILAAQAELDGLTLVTRDPAFTHFKVNTLW